MAFWRDMTCNWAADEVGHAGIMRGIQDNATVLGEQAKTHLSCDAIGEGAAGNYITWTAAASWAWVPGSATPIRALRTFDALGWRDISVNLIAARAGAGATTIRAFVLPRQGMAIDPTTGLVGAYDYRDMVIPGAAGDVGGSITPTHAQILTMEGVDFPIVWLHLAISGNVSVYVYTIRTREASA